MIPARGENYRIEIYKLKENTPFEWEEIPSLICYGRPASQVEVKSYRMQKGVNNSTDSTYLYCSNLPAVVKDGDRVRFLGKMWVVESVGYYFEENLVYNARFMSEDYIAKRCPKGISIH